MQRSGEEHKTESERKMSDLPTLPKMPTLCDYGKN